jgi:hypothetical protein
LERISQNTAKICGEYSLGAAVYAFACPLYQSERETKLANMRFSGQICVILESESAISRGTIFT